MTITLLLLTAALEATDLYRNERRLRANIARLEAILALTDHHQTREPGSLATNRALSTQKKKELQAMPMNTAEHENTSIQQRKEGI